MALGGIALGLGNGDAVSLLGAAVGVALLCIVGFRSGAGTRQFRRVELALNGKRRSLVALCDTGNSLRDPITGQRVIVVGADVAWELAGLTARELASPMDTLVASLQPGLRLIPYRAVGQPSGMLLGMRMDEVLMDGRKCGHIVAFAPQKLEQDGYEALAGGMA
jgi:stage II sporulation protein GA (sporulation sigma-E factor processing peptidase)